MSADRWSVCPNCSKNRHLQLSLMEDEVREKYGKIPQDEWKSLNLRLEAYKSGEGSDEPETLREDFDIGIYGNELLITYDARCAECSFRKTFRMERDIDDLGEP